MRRTPAPLLAFLLAAALAGCARTASVPATAPVAAASTAAPRRPTDELHWVRSSAEYRALVIQTFRAALEAAEEASAGRPPGSWAVCVDADETILDNSAYEAELQRKGQKHTEAGWKEWVKRRERPAIPGAAAFLASVQALGGRVAVVTNTERSLCDSVAANLVMAHLPYDVLVCRPDGDPDRKEPRFRLVADGTARPDLGPLEIVVFVGDNIQDFPEQSQALREGPESSFGEFGVRFFALPNPVYGTWERNSPR